MTPRFSETDFRKASGSGSGDCVEVAITSHTPSHIGMRDSKAPRVAVLAVPPGEWAAFTSGLRHSGAPD